MRLAMKTVLLSLLASLAIGLLSGCGEEKRVEAPNEKTAAPAVLPGEDPHAHPGPDTSSKRK